MSRIPQGFLSAVRVIWATLQRAIRAHPVTTSITLLVLVASVTRHILAVHSHGYWADSYRMIAVEGHWENIFVSLVSVPGPIRLVVALVLSIVGLGFAERRLGAGRTVVAWLVTGLGGLVVGLAVQWTGMLLRLPFAESSSGVTSFGPVIGIIGCVFASSAFAAQLSRWRIRLLGVAGLATLTLYSGEPGDLNRLAAAAIGLGLGDFLARDLDRPGWQRGTHVERRTLVAAVVAITGCGPLLTLLRPAGNGLFSPLAYLLSDWVPNRLERSSACFAAGWYCQSLGDAVRYDGLGAVLLNLLPTILLALAAYGMYRGRRFAAAVAVTVNGLVAIFVLYFYGIRPLQIHGGDWFSTSGAATSLAYLLLAIIPLGTVVLIVATFPSYPLVIPGRALRRFLQIVGIAFLALAASTIGLAFLVPGAFRHPPHVATVFADLPSRFIPSALLDSDLFPLVPTQPLVAAVYEWVGPAFWLVVIVAAFRLLAPPRSFAARADATRFRALLAEQGGGTFGFMATWPGNLYWFSVDRPAAVAYRVINGVAIALSDPVCAPGDEAETIRDFARFSDELGWTPVFYSVHEGSRDIFRQMGWSTVVVASEAQIPLHNLNFSGKRKQNVRTALNRADREGLTAVWASYGELAPSLASQLQNISDSWMKGRPLPEMGFTLGRFEQIQDPDVRLMVAVDSTGRVHAVTSWLPVQSRGAVVGYTLDFMRRDPHSMPGSMEFLVARTAQLLSEAGHDVLSLAGSPLTIHGELDAQPSSLDRVTAALGSWLEPVYGFSSLAFFKNAFEPTHTPVDLAFPDAMSVPKIASALARAYVPGLRLRHMLVVLRLSLRSRKSTPMRETAGAAER